LETGQRRDPAPPDIKTGKIFCIAHPHPIDRYRRAALASAKAMPHKAITHSCQAP
jgi:hypothetical protein